MLFYLWFLGWKCCTTLKNIRLHWQLSVKKIHFLKIFSFSFISFSLGCSILALIWSPSEGCLQRAGVPPCGRPSELRQGDQQCA